MSDHSTFALLEAARQLMARVPAWLLSRVDQHEAARLIAEIDRQLPEAAIRSSASDIKYDLRALWRDHEAVELDNEAELRVDARGSWVRAWLLAVPTQRCLTTERFLDALATLPLMPREVYRLLRIEGRHIQDVGRELGLSPVEIDEQLFTALRQLHEHLYSRS